MGGSLMDGLLELVDELKRQTAIRDAAQIEYDRLKTEIAVVMVSNGHEKFQIGNWNISVREQSRDTISKDLLVELGVGTDVIQAATKRSPYTVVDVRKVAVPKQEAA